MNLNFIGQIDEAKAGTRTDKTTGVITSYTQVTATFQASDKDGYLVKSTENIQLDINELAVMQSAKGKYASFPYTVINSKNGTYVFPSSELKVTIFEKNPLEIKK